MPGRMSSPSPRRWMGRPLRPRPTSPALTANNTTIRGGGKITLDGGPGALAVGLVYSRWEQQQDTGIDPDQFWTASRSNWGGPGMSLGNIVGRTGMALPTIRR